jgi:hypothetical protein
MQAAAENERKRRIMEKIKRKADRIVNEIIESRTKRLRGYLQESVVEELIALRRMF